MRVKRGAPRLKCHDRIELFGSAEEAWFWFARCQKLRLLGVAMKDVPLRVGRPCEPDDLYRTAMALKRAGRLQSWHLSVLGEFGMAERPPDPRCDEEERPARHWDEALDAMTTVLKKKGIVRCSKPAGGDE